MKKNIELIPYKKSFFEKIIDLIYLRIVRKKDIDKIFCKNSFLIKKQIVQEYAIDYLCNNFEINRLKNIWSKVSAFVKQEKYNQVKDSVLAYLDNNLENIDEIISKLPNEFKSLYKSNKINNLKFLDKYKTTERTNIKKEPKNNRNELFMALTELKVILSGFNEEVVDCIPENFIKFIEENYDRNYIPDINPLLNINRQNLLDKTKVLLALIYRKYVRL